MSGGLGKSVCQSIEVWVRVATDVGVVKSWQEWLVN